jgi:hypothetical protein
MVHSFTFFLWITLASSGGVRKALEFMGGLPVSDTEPFEFLRDAFQAIEDPGHLHQLAPERASLIAEFITDFQRKGKRKRQD